ncbi:hypothetical protein BDDG_12824 [Blastomyces dermatitidis ATCC 18188]|uniref:Uncharacterized protein n=1 Tax=Ajellomyces dermatitidis (strain ATCC 18188 / CBS 674.68) TaxID=653446 RepID=A0A0J9EQX1_AJEDA|nr:hypothetical protein BDDG_12824 [Blastomyces dermatitidis ATCC 18188]
MPLNLRDRGGEVTQAVIRPKLDDKRSNFHRVLDTDVISSQSRDVVDDAAGLSPKGGRVGSSSSRQTRPGINRKRKKTDGTD